MKELFLNWILDVLENILQDFVDDGKINGSVKKEILDKIRD